MKYIYVMISRTPTKFGSVIRKLGKIKYNHASVALDAELNEMYAFARLQHNTLLLAWLMPETIERFTLRKYKSIDVTIFGIPVTEEQYDKVRNTIDTIKNDPQYMYNYFSVISYPLFHGVETYKSYSCIEFVMHLLSDDLNISTTKPLCRYTPDDLLTLLSGYVHYQGDLIEYCKANRKATQSDENSLIVKREENKKGSSDYFAPLTFALIAKSFVAAGNILLRAVSLKRRV